MAKTISMEAMALLVLLGIAPAVTTTAGEENNVRRDKAASCSHGETEKKCREVEKVQKHCKAIQVLSTRLTHLRAVREPVQQELQKITADLQSLEREETQLIEWEKTLAEVQKNPESYGALSSSDPREQEMLAAYSAFRQAAIAHTNVLENFTCEHPEVKIKAAELECTKMRFINTTQRASAIARAMLTVKRNQMSHLRAKQESLRNDLATLEQRIVLAESELRCHENELMRCKEQDR